MLGCLLITGVVIFIFYINSPSPLPEESNQTGIAEANEILEKIDETKLAFQIDEALKEKGYRPYGGTAFQIYSADKQYVTILMENIDPKDKDALKSVQKVVDTVAKAYGFNLSVVDIQKVNN